MNVILKSLYKDSSLYKDIHSLNNNRLYYNTIKIFGYLFIALSQYSAVTHTKEPNRAAPQKQPNKTLRSSLLNLFYVGLTMTLTNSNQFVYDCSSPVHTHSQRQAKKKEYGVRASYIGKRRCENIDILYDQ